MQNNSCKQFNTEGTAAALWAEKIKFNVSFHLLPPHQCYESLHTGTQYTVTSACVAACSGFSTLMSHVLWSPVTDGQLGPIYTPFSSVFHPSVQTISTSRPLYIFCVGMDVYAILPPEGNVERQTAGLNKHGGCRECCLNLIDFLFVPVTSTSYRTSCLNVCVESSLSIFLTLCPDGFQ